MTQVRPTTRDPGEDPWYRQPWPWLLMAGPAIVVVAGLFTAWLAIATDDGLVADDYYKRGLLINKTLERQGRAGAMHVGAVVDIGADGTVRVDLSGAPAAATPALASVRLRLVHPTRAGHDVAVVLDRDASGAFSGRVSALPMGRWLVTVETDTWRLASVETVAPGVTRLGDERLAH